MAREIVNRQVNIYISSGEAQKAYDVLIKKEKELNAELAKTSDPKRMAALKGELDKLREPMDRLKKKVSGELTPTFRDLEAGVRKFLNEFKKTGSPEALANFKKFQSELNKMKDEINGLENSQKGFGKSGFFSAAFWGNLAAGAVTAAAAAVSDFFTSSIEEALNADAATSRLKSTLENLGRSDAFDRITRKADEMAQKFRYLDNDDIVGVFNKLIDYGKLTEQQMNDLLPVIVNFAAKSQISLDESTSIIVKALEGNGKALKEYGINIKDAGTESERLNVIMTTLKEKTDGAAEAFQNSAKGGIATARQEFANLKEEIGNQLIPVLNTLLGWLNKIFTGLQYLGQQTIKTGKILVQDLGSAVQGSIPGLLSGNFGQIVTGSIGEINKNKAAREKQKRDQIEAAGAQLAADTRTAEDLQSILDDQYKAKARKTSLLIRGELTKETFDTEVQRVDALIRVYSKALELRAAADESANKGLGINQEVTDKEKKNNKEVNKTLDERLKLIEELNKIQFEQTLVGIPQLEKDIKLMDKKYADLRTRAKGETEILIRIQKLYLTERIQLIDSYAEKEIEAWKRVNQKTMSEQEKQIVKNLQRLRDQANKMLNGENDGSIRKQTDLTLQNQQDDRDARNQRIQNLLDYASQATNIYNTLGQIVTDRENAELAADQAKNDRMRRNLESRLNAGTITQKQYQRELDKLDKEREKKEQQAAIAQFKRNKAANLAQALIDGAMAVSLVYRTVPVNIPGTVIPNPQFPKALISAIASRVLTIAAIAAAQPPKFARGGQLGGSSHAEGGNPILDGKTGRKIAEIEKGEGIINKRSMADGNVYTVTGTPSQIASGINGIAGGVQWNRGARLVPAWYSRQPVPMNFAAINRYFAAGGKFGTDPGKSTGDNNSQVMQMLAVTMDNMQMTIARMQSTLDNGIYAFTLLSDNEDAKARKENILNEATIKG